MKHDVVGRVRDAVERERLLSPGDDVAVALSGGADSMALLCALLRLKNALSLGNVFCLHVNHGLRGEESERDERFVREQCASMGVPLTVSRVDVASGRHKGESLEQAGRRFRYAFFEQAAHGAKIATAHTADDQAETILLHVMRGCGPSGLCGIAYRRGAVIRPLLDCTREEIEGFLASIGVPYVRDSSNDSLFCDRNRVRHRVLPAMREISPSVSRSLVRLGTLAKEEERFFSDVTRQAVRSAKTETGYRVSALLALPGAVRKRALLDIARLEGCPDCEQRHVVTMETLLSRGGGCTLPGGIPVRCVDAELRFGRQSPLSVPEPVPFFPGETADFGGAHYRMREISRTEWAQAQKIHKNLFSFCFSCDMIKGGLRIRSREDGDRFRPAGRGCTKSLKKLFQEAHLPIEMRAKVPVVCDDEGILLVAGFAPDERARVGEGTERILWLQPEEKGRGTDDG